MCIYVIFVSILIKNMNNKNHKKNYHFDCLNFVSVDFKTRFFHILFYWWWVEFSINWGNSCIFFFILFKWNEKRKNWKREKSYVSSNIILWVNSVKRFMNLYFSLYLFSKFNFILFIYFLIFNLFSLLFPSFQFSKYSNIFIFLNCFKLF